MKKTICLFLALSFLLFPLTASAAGRQNWYFTPAGENRRPGLPQVDPALAVAIGRDEKILYLTFDAGYENGNVAKIADVLKKNDVTGAFFVLKHFVEAEPDLVLRLRKDGNLICNHTSSHPALPGLSAEEIRAELAGVAQRYRELTGEEMAPFFRPPEGAWDEESLKTVRDAGYRTVFWSLAYADWDNDKQPAPEKALEKLEGRVHNGAVILLHPTSATNAAILDRFIGDMKEKGYRFGSLEEL